MRGHVAEVKEGLKVLAPRYKFKVTSSWDAFLIEAHTKCGEFVAAQNILRKLSFYDRNLLSENGSGAAKVYEQLYVDLMRELAKSGRIRSALALFDRMKQRGFAPSAEVYDVVIRFHIENQDNYLATEMVNEMRKEKVVPFAETIKDLIKLKASLYRSHECFALFNDCKTHGPQPDAALYAAFIAGLHYARKYPEVIHVFGEMIEKMRATRDVFHCALDASGRQKHRWKTRKIFARMEREMGRESLTEQDYAIYMAAIARTGDLDEALRILDVMHQIGLPRTYHTAYAMLSIAAPRNLEMARIQFAGMRESGYLTQSTAPWNEMIHAFLRNNDVSGARELFDEMRNSAQPFPDTHTYNLLLRTVDEDEMMTLFNEMKEKKVHPDSVAYHCVAIRLGKKGDMRGVERVVKEMRGAGFVISKSLMELTTQNTTVT